MGISAVIAASAATSVYTSRKAEKAQEKESARLAAIEKKQAGELEEANRQKAESTPFRSTTAAKRIGLERAYLRRSAGRGRAGTTIRRSRTLG